MPFPAATPVTARSLRRRMALAAMVGLPAVGLALVAPGGVASAATTDPPASIPAPAAMQQACYGGGSAGECEAAALAAIDVARSDEGVGALILPDNYDALSPTQQLLVLVNLERVDRGLSPLPGLDPTLDIAAQAAAVAGGDPVGPSGFSWSSTWAGGEPSALATDYDWVYDDGPGSPNDECPSDCWGHRNALLSTGGAAMGAGWSGSDWTVLIVGGWQGSTVFSWASELPHLHPDVPAQVPIAASPGTSTELSIPVAASGEPVSAQASVTSGPGYGIVVPSCTASPGSTCNLVVSFSPDAAGSWPATVSVSAPGGPYRVSIDGVSGHGYMQATSAGAVYAFGGSGWLGDLSHQALARPVVGIASTPDRGGYWMVASDGGVFSFGDATFHGSTGAVRLDQPIVGMAPTPDGQGYWLVASDGGIFSFGDAAFHGSTGAVALNRPIVGMAATPDGRGYWLVASDGGIFSFGDAAFHGSTGAVHLARPVVGMASTPDGGGYWLAASDGGVFSFGDAAFHGSTGGVPLVAPMTSITADPAGRGYWETASDGGVFNFGPPFLGSAAAESPTAAVVGTTPS